MSETPSSVRDRILEAAFDAFMRFGYSGASTAQIARLARVSKRDLYTHFSSKQAMLAACVTERAQRMRAPLDLPPPTDRAGLRQTLMAFGMTLVREVSRPEVLATYRLAILEADNAPDVAMTLDRQGRESNAAALTALLAAARERGLLEVADPAETAALFISVLMGGGLLVRLLMRVAEVPTEQEARGRAEAAVACLLRTVGGAG
jgi:AcrR family transcriptional regulator